MISNLPVSYNDVLDAFDLIKPHIHRTPVLTSHSLNRMVDAGLYFKCEMFQKTGSFKFRGATHAVLRLTAEEAKRGVITHSSGNHGAALACAAGLQGIKAYIVMPRTAPTVKVKAVEGYQGKITFCEPTHEARKAAAEELIKTLGATLIHPSENPHVIAGQGTTAMELLEEVPDLDYILAPIGGGGLCSGTALTAKGKKPGIAVIGCEPKNADDAYRSIQAGEIMPSNNPQTVADGLRISLGPNTFTIIRTLIDEIVLAEEGEIISTMKLLWERLKVVVEPSSATAAAPVFTGKVPVKGKRVGIILSGGNVDLEKLAPILTV